MSSEIIFPAFYHDLPGGKEKNAAKKLFFMYHVAERWPRLRLAKNLSNQKPRMLNPPPQLKLRSFASRARQISHMVPCSRAVATALLSQEPF